MVVGAYTDDRPCSLELQGTFTDKMHNLGWSQPGFFDYSKDEVALMRCIARYHT